MYQAAILMSIHSSLLNSALCKEGMFKEADIQINKDDTPWPSIGERFIIVHPVERYNANLKSSTTVEDLFIFGVTVGIHGRIVPHDRMANYLYNLDNSSTRLPSIELVRDYIINYLVSNIDIYSRITTNLTNLLSNYNTSIKNTLLNSSNSMSLIDRIMYLTTDASPIERYPDYFKSSQSPVDEPRPAGITLTTRFSAPRIVSKMGC